MIVWTKTTAQQQKQKGKHKTLPEPGIDPGTSV